MAVEGYDETIRALEQRVVILTADGRRGVHLAGQAYSNDVKLLAPYKTGTYRRSIHVQPWEPWGVRVGTDLPYARRLEYGFFMMFDKLGRQYFQTPRPHFRAAMDLNYSRYLAIIKAEIGRGAI